MKSILRSSLCWVVFAALMGACDVLNEETVPDYDVRVLTDKVFISEQQSSATISLNTLIRAKVPVKFSIAEGTNNGTLDVSTIDDGIIKYSSGYGALQADKFSFSIISTNNEMLRQQQVNLVVAQTQDELPCNTVLPFRDHFINLGAPGTVVTLDVLKNDWMCEEMRSKVQLMIDDPRGRAVVTSDNKIRYTVPEWSPDNWEKTDYGGYIIALKSDPSIRWYGEYGVTFDDTCNASAGYMDDNDPTDGFFGFSLPMATAPLIKFNPLSNASLCGYSLSEVDVSILHQPKFGTAHVYPSKSFSYTPSNTERETYTDLIIFKVSLPNGKWACQVIKLRLASDKPCTQGAVDDVIGVENVVRSVGGQLLPVIANDCNRQAIKSISIVTPPVHGVGTVGTWFNTWSIMYRLNTPDNLDEIVYEALYEDGTTSSAKVYITPYNFSN